MDSYSLTYGYYIPRCLRKFCWVEFQIVACTWHLLHPHKKTQTQAMIAFAMRGATSSSICQSHVACLSHSQHVRHDFSHVTDSYQCAWFIHFLHDLPFVEGSPLSYYVVNLLIPPGADYHYPDVARSSVDANLILPFSALNQNLLLIRLSFPQTAPIIRTVFGLNSQIGMDSGPTSSNNKFVEIGRKSQSESRENISIVSVQGVGLHLQKYKKRSPLSPSSVINTLEFSLFTVVFLQPFFLSYFFLCPLFFEFIFLLYTMVSAPYSPSTCKSGVGSFPVPSRTSLNLLLLAVRLLVHCSGITSTLMRPES